MALDEAYFLQHLRDAYILWLLLEAGLETRPRRLLVAGLEERREERLVEIGRGGILRTIWLLDLVLGVVERERLKGGRMVVGQDTLRG